MPFQHIRTNLAALDASSGELNFIALAAVDLLALRHEALRANGDQALAAEEAGLVPLFALVLQLALARLENLAAGVAASAEEIVVAVAAVDLLVLRTERLLEQGLLALATHKAALMPVALLVRQVLVDSRKRNSTSGGDDDDRHNRSV